MLPLIPINPVQDSVTPNSANDDECDEQDTKRHNAIEHEVGKNAHKSLSASIEHARFIGIGAKIAIVPH